MTQPPKRPPPPKGKGPPAKRSASGGRLPKIDFSAGADVLPPPPSEVESERPAPSPPSAAKRTPPAVPPRKRPTPPPLPVVGEERRAHPRYDVLAQVQVTRETEVHILSASNISRGGFFLCVPPDAELDLEVGAEVEVLLFSPEEDAGPEIAARAKVMRTVTGDASCGRGYGLRFESFRAGDVFAFDEFLGLLTR